MKILFLSSTNCKKVINKIHFLNMHLVPSRIRNKEVVYKNMTIFNAF